MLLELVFVFLIVLIGSFIQGSSGFGFGLFAMGLLPIIFSLKDSTLLVLSLTLIVSLSIVIRIYKYIEWKGLIFILSAALTGRVFSFFFLTTFGEMELLKKYLGFFLIGMVLYLVFKRRKESSPVIMHPIFPIVLGFIGGFIGGVFAVGGPFFVFYFLMLYHEKHRYNANLQVTFFLTSLFTLILHGVHGDLHTTFFMYFFTGLVSVFIGTNIGLLFFERLSPERVQKLAMSIVFIAAMNLILFT